MKKISVIIPRHNESADFMHSLFSSIDIQAGINFDDIEVLIVNDDPTDIITDFSRYINIKPKNLTNQIKPGFPGISRQIGIDNAEGEFLVFCDADDMLHASTIFAEYFAKISSTDPSKQFDILITNFIEECKTREGRSVYSVHSRDFTWMFGKLYRRSFIVNNNIRFNPDLRVHEDTYFNALFRAYNCRVMFNDEIAYIWRFNPNSITRNNDAEYSFNSLETFIDAVEKSIDEIQRRNVANINGNVYHLMGYIYTLLQTEQWQGERPAKFKTNIENRLAKFYKKYQNSFVNMQKDALYKTLNDEYQGQIKKSGLFMIRETWEAFIERILKQCEAAE